MASRNSENMQENTSEENSNQTEPESEFSSASDTIKTNISMASSENATTIYSETLGGGNTSNWMQEVEQMQASPNFMCPRKSFKRLVREIAQDFSLEIRFTTKAFEALQYAAEDELTEVFDSANLLCIHRGCETILPKDMHLALRFKRFNTT